MTGCPSLEVASIEFGHFASDHMSPKRARSPAARPRAARTQAVPLNEAQAIGRRLQQLRKAVKPKLTQEALGKKIGLTQQDITRVETGRADYSRYRDMIARELGTSVDDLRRGLGFAVGSEVKAIATPPQHAMPPSATGVRQQEVSALVPTMGTAAAGRWIDPTYLDDGPMVPRAINPTWYNYEQYALKTEGPSMNKEMPDGSIVIFVPYAIARKMPKNGDVVHAIRRRGLYEEWTVRLLRIEGGIIELWPNSNDPRFQEPYRFDASTNTQIDDEDITLEIRGLALQKTASMLS